MSGETLETMSGESFSEAPKGLPPELLPELLQGPLQPLEPLSLLETRSTRPGWAVPRLHRRRWWEAKVPSLISATLAALNQDTLSGCPRRRHPVCLLASPRPHGQGR